MKSIAIISVIALIGTVQCWSASPSPEQIHEFSSQVADFLTKSDFSGIQSLYYLDGTPAEFTEKTMMIWQARVMQDIPEWKFTGVEYFPYDDVLNRPGINKEAIESVTKETQINGNPYIPNTPVIGLLSVNFSAGQGGNNFLYPVGMTPDGKLCFVGKKPAN